MILFVFSLIFPNANFLPVVDNLKMHSINIFIQSLKKTDIIHKI